MGEIWEEKDLKDQEFYNRNDKFEMLTQVETLSSEDRNGLDTKKWQN